MKKIIIAFIIFIGFIYVDKTLAAPSNTYDVGYAANGIAGSRHNLGSLGTHTITDSTTEICVFCHTPHHSKTAASAPLWNRKITASGYTAYGTTLGGTVIGIPGSTSLACLSCHDGVTTLDNLVNAPGKGGVTSGGASQSWKFYNGGVLEGTSPNVENIDTRLNIGMDLSNDHPVSVTYDSTVASLRPTSTVISSIDLDAGMVSSATSFDAGNLTRNLWDVKGSISNTATIGDLLRGGKVECNSCHDPHFSNSTGTSIDQGLIANISDSADGLFLRRVGGNVGSAVCRTCHNK